MKHKKLAQAARSRKTSRPCKILVSSWTENQMSQSSIP